MALDSSAASLMLTITFNLVVLLIAVLCFPLLRKWRGDKKIVRPHKEDIFVKQNTKGGGTENLIDEHQSYMDQLLSQPAPSKTKLNLVLRDHEGWHCEADNSSH